MKLKHILMTGLLAFAAAACSNDDDKIVVEQVTGPTEVNLISCNITTDNTQHTGNKAWKVRRAALLEMVSNETPDILCMQGQLWNQVIYLTQQLPAYGCVDYNVNGNDSSTGLHNTIMFRSDKYTLLDEGRYWLSQSPTSMSYPWASKDDNRRITTWALLKDNATHARFIVMSTHFNDGDEPEDNQARINSADLNIDKIEELIGEEKIAVIIAGDFNATDDTADSRRDCIVALGKTLTDARTDAASSDSKPSFNGFGDTSGAARLAPDHIFMLNATPLSFATLNAQYGGVYLSDHNPISSKIKF